QGRDHIFRDLFLNLQAPALNETGAAEAGIDVIGVRLAVFDGRIQIGRRRERRESVVPIERGRESVGGVEIRRGGNALHLLAAEIGVLQRRIVNAPAAANYSFRAGRVSKADSGAEIFVVSICPLRVAVTAVTSENHGARQVGGARIRRVQT